MDIPFLSKRKSLADLQQEDEMLDARLSVAQKRALLRDLENRGGDKESFRVGTGGKLDFKRIFAWLKAH